MFLQSQICGWKWITLACFGQIATVIKPIIKLSCRVNKFCINKYYFRFVWMLFVMCVYILFVAQVSLRTMDFYKYSTTLDVHKLDETELKFPAVTICNQNNFRSVYFYARKLDHNKLYFHYFSWIHSLLWNLCFIHLSHLIITNIHPHLVPPKS